MTNFETWIKTHPECFLNFFDVVYCRIQQSQEKKCRLDNIKDLTRVFELWVSQKQLQVTLKCTRSGVFTAILSIFYHTKF